MDNPLLVTLTLATSLPDGFAVSTTLEGGFPVPHTGFVLASCFALHACSNGSETSRSVPSVVQSSSVLYALSALEVGDKVRMVCAAQGPRLNKTLAAAPRVRSWVPEADTEPSLYLAGPSQCATC